MGALPAAFEAIEAAFPDRFIRGRRGDLSEAWSPAAELPGQDQSTVRFGFDYSRPIGPATAPAPRNQVFQELRRAGIVGCRPPAQRSAARRGRRRVRRLPPGAQGLFPGAPGAPPDGATPPAEAQAVGAARAAVARVAVASNT